eukprot:CAMPEP_0204338064 /NCGR_PEP_ID=MMETSP0469-20131031/20800_1 /ASSEMBLY_ACC=CAM_ASM_000384 /TAXON_ID=2969 /ORGANISM="Oxyrrhis marina" /LENGTH=62 /DNA_ID=CAMNT_0051322191 /DNA_START=33 /DNA_END=217 /DNA_ORIENTATION=+
MYRRACLRTGPEAIFDEELGICTRTRASWQTFRAGPDVAALAVATGLVGMAEEASSTGQSAG